VTANRLERLLGIDLPIIQAPMAGAQGSALAAAVCEAGGLGSLPCAMLGPDAMRDELVALAANRRPWCVNFFCHQPPAPDPEREARWRTTLAPYYAELGLDPEAKVTAPARRPFDADAAALVEEFAPPVVSFHFGLPSEDLLARVRRWGAKVLATATTVAEGRWLEARGVDAVVAQGREAGGHRGDFLGAELGAALGTAVLVGELVSAVKAPVIATGGVADPSAVAAMIALGAAGVQVGTAYLLCPEATTSAVHRAALRSDAARQTVFTNLMSGRAARGIVNRLMRELGPMRSDLPPFPLPAAALAPLRARAEALGRSDFSPLWAGESDVVLGAAPAGEITRQLAAAVRL
jgi:nitronate monooxygenase